MDKKARVLLEGLFLALVLILFGLSVVSAFTVSVTPSYVNRSANAQVNFTITNTEALNITQIIITFPYETTFYAGSNATNASNAVFSNISVFGQKILIWANTTAAGIMGNRSSNNNMSVFSFNVSLRNLGNAFFTNFTITSNRTDSSGNYSSYNFPVNFAFAAYVKNETGGAQNASNITIYRFVMGQNGPPTQTYESSVLSDANGYFAFPDINGSADAYLLKILYYNSSGTVTKVSTTLPAFPGMMYYPSLADIPAFQFMRPPSLNGTSFYLQPAATLRLYARNDSATSQSFGYQVIDQTTGFPTESNMMAAINTTDVYIPIDRNYTVMFARAPFGSSGFTFDPRCDGSFMNSSSCPTPPISYTTSTLVQGQIFVVNQSLIVSNPRLYGCINISAGNNNTNLNITSLSLKMVPWGSGTKAFPYFLPPMRADRGDINIASDISYNLTLHPECTFAFYNISIMGATTGLQYMVEMYAKNTTSEAQTPGATAWQLAAFQNVTMNTTAKSLNITLYRLGGSFYAGDLNTSRFKISIQNSTGGAITNNINANIVVKNPTFGTVSYIIESMSSGVFYLPILNNSNSAKITVFANDAPPKELTLNLSQAENNITLVTMTDGRGVGMKRINASGGMEMINSTQLDVSMPIQMRFLRNTAECNVRNPADSCAITSIDAKNFNPLIALVAGKVNMELKITSTNVTLTFVNFDMFAAKQPPMDSVMNDQATSGGSSANQTWQFGSFAPSNTYDYATMTMPYSDSVINDSANISMQTPLFYDENWNVIYNKTRGDTAANLTDDFIDYNSTALYRNYLSSTGVTCNSTDPNLNVTPCYVNTTSNNIYMRIPHFSGVAPGITGNAPVTTTTTTTTTTTGGGGGAGANNTDNYWYGTFYPTQSDFNSGYTANVPLRYRIRVDLNGTAHYVGVTNLTATTAIINVSSTPQTAVLAIGEEKKFDANEDGQYDILVRLDSISSTAKLFLQATTGKVPVAASNASNQTTTTANQTITDNTESEKTGTSTKTIIFWIVGIVVVLLIIILAYKIIIKGRYYKKGY